jgi:hypothetical protein
MSKTVSLFVFAPIVAAAVATVKSEGAFVRAIVEARQPLRGTPSEAQMNECLTAMGTAWRKAGLEKDSLKVYISCASTLLSCPMKMLLEACEVGHGRNGVMKRVNAMVQPPADSSKPKRGRPAGQGKGKTTATVVVETKGPISQHLQAAQAAMAQCLKWEENGKGLTAAQADTIKDFYNGIAAVLGSVLGKKKSKAEPVVEDEDEDTQVESSIESQD